MEEESTADHVQQVEIFPPGEGETVTLSLDAAAQLILQQHGIAGKVESGMQPVTYQIVTQHTLGSGDEAHHQIQLALSDGVNVLHCTNPADLALLGQVNQDPGVYLQAASDDLTSVGQILQLPSSAVCVEDFQGLTATTQDNDNVIITASQAESAPADGNVPCDGLHDEKYDSQSESSLQIDLPSSLSESTLQVIGETSATGISGTTSSQLLSESLQESVYTQSILIRPSSQPPAYTQVTHTSHDIIYDDAIGQQVCKEEREYGGNHPVSNLDPDPNENIVSNDLQVTEHRVINGVVTEPKGSAPEKRPDLDNPIKVQDNMEIMINGRKCMLKMNSETQQMCAYPILPPIVTGKKQRGRPRKSEMSRTESPSKKRKTVGSDSGGVDQAPATPDPTDSAAQVLLELSNTGPDGVRRSGRVRRKAKVYEDYEIKIEASDDEAAVEDEDDPSVTGIPLQHKPQLDATFTPTSIHFPPVVKRGRGRPRRYPRPGDVQLQPQQIPAMIIPSLDGHSIMMAPLQGLTNIQAIQEQFKSLTPILPKAVETGDEDLLYVNSPVLPVPVNIVLNNSCSGESMTLLAADGTPCRAEQLTEANDETAATISAQPIPTLEDSQELELTQAAANSETGTLNVTLQADKLISRTPQAAIEPSTEMTQPTIIQIPEDLLPMFMQRRDPVKIGLKASDVELGQLKCAKCGFQAYYEQQYQEHITTHTDDVEKCKCCNFVSFDKEDLLSHFKESHPKCICMECEHMAEHAYVIKRHMMRHSQEGCKCDICGKCYKDQYVLKMHVKMVHLPAEVLFECTVCCKKFTRKAHLKRHLRIHDPEKPFKCPHCLYRGCERSDISKHLLIHEDPKHVCDVCGKAFRHIKNKELHLKRHNGQRDYKCGVCDFYGYTFTDIRKHIERKHTDVKTVICDKCGSTFRTDQQLAEHKLRQCEVFMIEQALAIATSGGGTSQATLQIPTSLSQQIHIDGQNIALDGDGNVNITVEQISLPSDVMGLTPEQLQTAVAQGQLLESGQVELTMVDDVGHDVQLEIAEDVGHDVGLDIADDVGQDAALDGVDLEDEDELETQEDEEELDSDGMDDSMNGIVTIITQR